MKIGQVHPANRSEVKIGELCPAKWVKTGQNCSKTGSSWQAPKSTRKRNTPENAENRPFQKSAFSGELRFRVCFGALFEGNKEHPKTQHTRKRRFSERSVFCVFGCVAFSGAFCSPLIKGRSLEIAVIFDKQKAPWWDAWRPPENP